MSQRADFHRWHYRAGPAEPAVAPVLPDGCRDLLVIRAPGAPERIELSALDGRPRHASLPPGSEIIGYRLRPGCRLPAGVMAEIARDSTRAGALLREALPPPDEAEAAIAALAMPGAEVAGVARDLGVSPRTLERRFRALGLPVPGFWRALGRARLAAMRLARPEWPLADLALAAGYADQAHLSRELCRWFGAPPGRLRADPGRMALLAQPALGNWTGLHSSIR